LVPLRRFRRKDEPNMAGNVIGLHCVNVAFLCFQALATNAVVRHDWTHWSLPQCFMGSILRGLILRSSISHFCSQRTLSFSSRARIRFSVVYSTLGYGRTKLRYIEAK
jgi:hypothetical protein